VTVAPELHLRTNVALFLGGGLIMALISAASLPWPSAIASTTLGTLMIAGAEVDARTYLLPDTITIGAMLLGLVFAPALDPSQPWLAAGIAIARAAGAAFALMALRWIYALIRDEEGLGLGDVKLAAVGGAWLSLSAIPLWLALASAAALVSVGLARLRGEAIDRTTRVPFGAFLCPALWLVYYATTVLDTFPFV
jgi:leader peptidase (prepilin peptidase) / N-methyltransferase